MIIDKNYIENWLEDFISKNPNADTFDLAIAAMQHGFDVAGTIKVA